MSKADTIAALKRSAIEHFASYGFEGASLRTIASSAGVPLSAVHIYFGSKAELYVEVGRQVWNELHQERIEIFREAAAANPDSTQQLSDLIYALAYPIVRRAMSNSAFDAAEIRIIRSVVWQRVRDDNNMHEMGDEAIQYWIDRMHQLCPSLTQAEVVWAYSLVVSAIYSWQLVDHRYDKFVPVESIGGIDDVMGDLVAFGTDGISAMVERRKMRSNS